MRWILAAILGGLSGAIYMIAFASRAEPEPLVVFALAGILVAIVDALISGILSQRSDSAGPAQIATVTHRVLRAGGMCITVVLSALAVSVTYLSRMAP
jgi:hypothetical protein